MKNPLAGQATGSNQESYKKKEKPLTHAVHFNKGKPWNEDSRKAWKKEPPGAKWSVSCHHPKRLRTRVPNDGVQGGLFAEYVDAWLKIKTEASGWPANCNTGFDGVFILKTLYKHGWCVTNQFSMGAMVLTFKSGSITFKDSLSRWGMGAGNGTSGWPRVMQGLNCTAISINFNIKCCTTTRTPSYTPGKSVRPK